MYTVYGGKVFCLKIVVLHSFVTKTKDMFICKDRQNYERALRVYNGPSHHYTGRLDRKEEDLISFKPYFEKAE